MAYDLANRLKTHVSGNTTTTYLYDGGGVRLQASTGAQANKKTKFLWDTSFGLPQLALERDGNNALLRRYLYGDRRISMTAGSNTRYFIHDGLGSVANVTSSSGATQWTWSYEPFGSIRTEQKASGNQPDNFLKFTGEYLDPTGLYHLRARQYDPGIGRFLRPDPVEPELDSPFVGGYAYVASRPTVLVDPSGEVFRPAAHALQAATLGATVTDRWGSGFLCGFRPCPRELAPDASRQPTSVRPPGVPNKGCLLAVGLPYLNQLEDRVEFLLTWRCLNVLSVSVLGILLKNDRIADTWTNWNPFQYSGEHTLKEKCRGDTARYQSFGSLSLRAIAWPPWRSGGAESGKVKISC